MAINSNRKKEYEMASENTQDPHLTILFSKFAKTSQQCRKDLSREITNLGGDTQTDGFYEVSPGYYCNKTGDQAENHFKDKKTALYSCSQTEDETADSYRAVFAKIAIYLSPNQQKMIRSQFTLLKTDYKKIKMLSSMIA